MVKRAYISFYLTGIGGKVVDYNTEEELDEIISDLTIDDLEIEYVDIDALDDVHEMESWIDDNDVVDNFRDDKFLERYEK